MSKLDDFFKGIDKGRPKIASAQRAPYFPGKQQKTTADYALEAIDGFHYAHARTREGSRHYKFTIIGNVGFEDERTANEVLAYLTDMVKQDIASKYGMKFGDVLLNTRTVKADGKFKIAFDSAHEEHLDAIRWRVIRSQIESPGQGPAR